MTSVNTECDPIGELADEFAIRCRRGERPAVTEYAERYPKLAGRIRQVFPVMAIMEGATPSKADRPATNANGLSSVQETRHCRPTQIGDYRIIREIGSLSAALGGLEGLVFTGGIGQRDAKTRREVAAGCAWLGAELDETRNNGAEGLISTDGSRLPMWVVSTDEERVIARQTSQVLGL